MKRLIIIAFLTFVIGGAGLAFYVWRKTRIASPHIAVTGGQSLFIRLPVVGKHFLQNDPRWAAEKIGGSGESIKGVGCAMCSVASAAQYLGETTDPGTFNHALIQAGGYTERGWLVWSAVGQVFEKRLEVDITRSPSHTALDQALKQGHYPVVKFFLPMGIPHWAVVVGKEGLEYLVYDPLLPSTEPAPLSKRASGIYSVRIVKKST